MYLIQLLIKVYNILMRELPPAVCVDDEDQSLGVLTSGGTLGCDEG